MCVKIVPRAIALGLTGGRSTKKSMLVYLAKRGRWRYRCAREGRVCAAGHRQARLVMTSKG